MTIAVAICARNPAALTLHVITMDYRETWPHALLIKRDALMILGRSRRKSRKGRKRFLPRALPNFGTVFFLRL